MSTRAILFLEESIWIPHEGLKTRTSNELSTLCFVQISGESSLLLTSGC